MIPETLTKIFKYMDEDVQYEEYLKQHYSNVQKAYNWMKDNIPELLSVDNYYDEICYYGEMDEIIAQHDSSKRRQLPDSEDYYDLTCEYNAYADYFYGERTAEVEAAFDKAWLSHIHRNPHHWQHWVLVNDDDGIKAIDMPYVFIVEMVADWWSFSWKQEKLDEIFSWYDQRKERIILSEKTRERLHKILDAIKIKLTEEI